MPIKPQPELIRCPKCDWKIVHAPQSDALIEPRPDVCPKCGNEELEVKPAGILDAAISPIISLLKETKG